MVVLMHWRKRAIKRLLRFARGMASPEVGGAEAEWYGSAVPLLALSRTMH